MPVGKLSASLRLFLLTQWCFQGVLSFGGNVGEETNPASALRAAFGSKNVLTKKNENYTTATMPEFLMTYSRMYSPDAIVYPETTAEVAAVVRLAKQNGHTITPASGRHGSAGYCFSGQITVDLRRMNNTYFDEENELVVAEAGVHLGMIIELLQPLGYITATGVCSGVGISGWTLGGGYSPFSKGLGLGVDNVAKMEVVLASGEVVTASITENPELFWALRGAGHQNFGFVTKYFLRTKKLSRFGLYHASVPIEMATPVFKLWNELYFNNETWAESIIDTYSLQFGRGAKGGPMEMGLDIVWPNDKEGAVEEFTAMLQPLLELIGDRSVLTTGPEFVVFDAITTIDDMWSAGWDFSAVAEAKVGLYLEPNPTPEDIETLVKMVQAAGAFQENTEGVLGVYIVLEPYAGAATAPAPADTAFVHRPVMGDWYVDIFTEKEDAPFEASEKWLQGLYQGPDALLGGLLKLYEDGPTAYQNYKFAPFGEGPDRLGALKAYYATNLCELVRLKRKFDPDGLFDFPQGIPLIPEGPGNGGIKGWDTYSAKNC